MTHPPGKKQVHSWSNDVLSYAKAAAKEKGLVEKELWSVIVGRPERLLLLFVGIILAIFDPLYLTYMIVLLAVLTNISALQRIRIATRSKPHTGF